MGIDEVVDPDIINTVTDTRSSNNDSDILTSVGEDKCDLQ
jgi:hypothetical protein